MTEKIDGLIATMTAIQTQYSFRDLRYAAYISLVDGIILSDERPAR